MPAQPRAGEEDHPRKVRKGLEQGVSMEEIRAVSLLAITTCGFRTAIAGLGWIEDVLQGEGLEVAK